LSKVQKNRIKEFIMTTIYLHIGMPKTGTTSLQNFLFDNREKLLDKGYLYPLLGMRSTRNITDFNHHGLANALLKKYDTKTPVGNAKSKSEWEGSWEELKKQINTIKPKNVIISSEIFTTTKYFYNPNTIALVKKILEEHETKIVIYLRRQDDFLRSLYCQFMKSPLPNKVPNTILLTENHTNKNMAKIREFVGELKYQANYHSTLELWKNSFGIKSVIVRVFEKEQMRNGNVVDDFLATINFTLKDGNKSLKFSDFKNVSYSGKVIKLINLIESASQIRRLPKGKYWYLYTKFAFLRMDSRIKLAMLLSRFIPDFLVSEELLSEEDRESIMKEFEESNQKVAKEYLGREDGKLFYAKS